jgi:hypothetical protein
MPRRPFFRPRPSWSLIAVFASCLCGNATAQGSIDSNYLGHQTDPVQQIYSGAVLGYALNQKCRQLNDVTASDYERRLNQATMIFQGYVVAQRFVPNASQAIEYTQGMLLGAARFAALSECDTVANDKVQSGYQTAQTFVPLLRELFAAPGPKQ